MKEKFIKLIYDETGELLLIETMNVPDDFRKQIVDLVKDLKFEVVNDSTTSRATPR